MNTLPRFFALLLAAALIGPACSTTPDPAEKDAMERERLAREVDDELLVGREIASRLLGRFQHYEKNRAAIEYVNLVGATLAAQNGRPELRYRFAILDSDDPNAFACPGGFIFVTKGLLKLVKNESELAGVLGHEIAHVNEKHMYSTIVPKREVSTSETFVRLLSRGKSEIGSNLAQIVDNGMKMLMESGYGKEKEHASDQAAALYTKSSGYDPMALLPVLERLKEASKSSKLSKTHPPFDERTASFQAFLKENDLKSTLSASRQQVMEARFLAVLKKEAL
ncbi:MAG: hypothetical protein A2428_00730 [Bdellovibrionales bacterium RIFOXYC1_FULL_54_43]|nr:MAG: hypothetical protein A2428_00730 [Bdellovibrionales bacterium RIFOXYC1_FULL_54_43]OFZ82111.1 MAG: hypothetical protein A2603_11430 [Bdellovibrionales bacterium RIFOXYD1_FULL_55_31]